MRSALALVCLCVTGCSIFDKPAYERKRDSVTVTVDIVDDSELADGVYGTAKMMGDYCHVKIRRSTYPMCITHEIRHCLEGAFHPKKAANSDDC